MEEKIVILGAGESGVGAAILAKKLGFDVFVSDDNTISENRIQELKDHQIDFEQNGHELDQIHADLIVKSPGIADDVPVVKMFASKEIPIISEIEFAASHYAGEIIAITGTNGKTTTTGLIYHLLKNHVNGVEIGGNYGVSFARMLAEGSPDVVVLEISSFQLEGIRNFHPHISVILNISADHLDRYAYQMSRYVDAKMRITMNQIKGDHFIYNADDSWITSRMHNVIKSNVNTIAVVPNRDKVMIDGQEYELNNPYLQGNHNVFNAQCAIEVALRMDVSKKEILNDLDTFVNVPHRMEPVDTVDGVTYINDSKGTNVNATQFALESIDNPIIWIAGGTDKGNDYRDLRSSVKNRVKALLCLGVDNGKIINSFDKSIDVIEEFDDMEKCVERASQISEEGDVVLLSPACASFDLFTNYIDRGDQFKAAVLKLRERVRH